MIALCFVAFPAAATGNGFAVKPVPEGQIIKFTDTDVSFAATEEPPATGWDKRKYPLLWLTDEAREKYSGDLYVWARFRFDRAELPDGKLAIFTEDNREQVSIFVNGIAVFRNYPDDRAQVMGWNHPYLVPLDRSLLQPGTNEISLRMASGQDFALGVGSVSIGPHAALSRAYDKQHFFRIEAPKVANWTMLLLSMLVIIMWLGRRDELELIWLGLTGILWFVRNYHFFSHSMPIDPLLFQQITFYSIYFAVAVALIFCAEFLKLKNRRIIIIALLGIGVLLSLFRIVLISSNQTDILISLMTVLVLIYFWIVLIRHWQTNKTIDSLILFAVLFFAAITGVHDIGRIPEINWWEGAGFHFQPYVGLFLFLVFLMSLARRFLSALSLVEETNIHLEQRVREATDALTESEAVRRQLEVERALETERERLMREMHDGIGSNLVTALAVAHRRNDPQQTISTLKRALGDLKITVDSLAPIEGDVVTLLGSLRYRMERELQEAGIVSTWEVEDCPKLTWMDASHSLNLLRLLQEAISNILMHSGADNITLACKPARLGERDGVVVIVSDNGSGFDPEAENKGKGLFFMKKRAEALEAKLQITSASGRGSKLALWLPA